jgi:hypothetical protein
MDLSIADCRTIFLDWILGHPGEAGPTEIRALLDAYGATQPDHPMTRVLEAGLAQTSSSRTRRGGARGRRGGESGHANPPARGGGRVTD